MESPGKNTGVGSHSLLQGSFSTQGSNLGLLLCRQILYHLSHEGKLKGNIVEILKVSPADEGNAVNWKAGKPRKNSFLTIQIKIIGTWTKTKASQGLWHLPAISTTLRAQFHLFSSFFILSHREEERGAFKKKKKFFSWIFSKWKTFPSPFHSVTTDPQNYTEDSIKEHIWTHI